MNKLTERQNEVYKFIKDYCAEWGYSPTRRDIAKHFGIQVNAVQQHVTRLREKGYINFRNDVARSIVVLEPIQ